MVKIVKGGFVINLIDFFFLVLIINSFIFFYSIYLFFDNKVFKNQQGYKLNLKTYCFYSYFFICFLLTWLVYFRPYFSK